MHISQAITLLGEEWTTSFYKRQSHMSWFRVSLSKDHFALRYEESMTAGWGTRPSLQAGGFVGFLDSPTRLPDGPVFENHQLGTLRSPGVFLLRHFSAWFKKNVACLPPFPSGENFVVNMWWDSLKKARNLLSGSPTWSSNQKREM